MLSLEYARSRLRAFLAEVSRLRESEFPYPDSEAALDLLEQRFSAKLIHLESLGPGNDPAVIKQQCAHALTGLFDYLPILGFILRSTNVRNAFEVYRPLRRLARNVLEPTVDEARRATRILLSSEWDYSPLIYWEMPDLPDFALIGMPAPESSNPLLIPLAGHELGHSVWAKTFQTKRQTPKLQSEIVGIISGRWAEFQTVFPSLGNIQPGELTSNLYAREAWIKSFAWAMSQAEESFCDFVGLRIFGSSYLHAFAYLLSPNMAGPRPEHYPNLKTRGKNLVRAAAAYSIPVSADYDELFDDMPAPSAPAEDAFRLSVADDVLEAVVPALIHDAGHIIESTGICLPNDRGAEQIYKRFLYIVPAEGAHCLADILNAGWLAAKDTSLWSALPHVASTRDIVLCELILKTCEVFEYEQIMRE
jgi:hypothetical protein